MWDEEFTELVKQWRIKGITHLIDIRLIPYCSYTDAFSKTDLNGLYSHDKIHYIHIAELGNPFRNSLQKFKTQYIGSDKFITGLQKLFSIIFLKKTIDIVVFCNEKDHNFCHRTIIKEYIDKLIATYNLNLKTAHWGIDQSE